MMLFTVKPAKERHLLESQNCLLYTCLINDNQGSVSQNICHEEIFHSVRFEIKLQYIKRRLSCALYDSILHYTRIKKITHEHLSGFTGLCILHFIILFLKLLIGQLTAYLLNFGLKLFLGKYDVI